MKFNQNALWAGTQQAYAASIEASEGMQARLASGDYGNDNDEEEVPRLLQVQDGVAVISISGPLVSEDSWMNQYFGVTSYGEIREAALAAAHDQNVSQILLDVSSGGGAVSGVEDAAKLIRLINDNVKPVTAYIDGIGASAAYWLASSASKVYAGKTAVVGSIGVISTHKEYSEYFKQQGIGVTVIRAGSEKALANSNEPLPEKGRQQIQQVANAVYDVFVEHIAGMRGKSIEYARDHMADGKEFVGQAGVDAGLLDGIMTFDALMSDLKEKSIDDEKSYSENRLKPAAGITMRGETNSSGDLSMKQALTEQDIAAIAAGAPIALAASAAEPVAASAEDANGVVEAASDVAAVEADLGAKADQKLDNSAATIQLLNEQLKAKDSALIEANVKLAKLNDQVQETQATHGPLVEIACKAINNMQIALGGSAVDVSAAGAVAVLAEHKRLSEAFVSKFKGGGVAAVTPSVDPVAEAAPVVDAITQARLNAVRFKN